MILMSKGYITAEMGNCFLRKFDPSSMNILLWINSFEYLADTSNINDYEKNSVLLNMLEPVVLNKIHEKIYPLTPFHLSYDEIILILQNTYSSFETIAAANYRYKYREQLPLESIQHYISTLLKLYDKCDFATKANINIKDRFVDGISDEDTKDILEMNNYENMPLAMVVTIAKQIEISKNVLVRDTPSR